MLTCIIPCLLMSVERWVSRWLVWVHLDGLALDLQMKEWSLEQEHTPSLFTGEVGPISGTRGCCELDQTLKQSWEIESYGTELSDQIVCTEEEKVAFEKSVALFITTMRYLAWPCHEKEKRPQLPNNRQMAESHLLNTEKSLKKKEFVEKEYQKTIDIYVEKGYLRKVPENEAPTP